MSLEASELPSYKDRSMGKGEKALLFFWPSGMGTTTMIIDNLGWHRMDGEVCTSYMTTSDN